MKTRNVVVRAVDLARSGAFTSIAQVADQLKEENFEAVDAHLESVALKKVLTALLIAETEIPPKSEESLHP